MREGLDAADARTRLRALGALARQGRLRLDDLLGAFADRAPEVRRRACELVAELAERQAIEGQAGTIASHHDGGGEDLVNLATVARLHGALEDHDSLVVEAACFALGELGTAVSDEMIRSLGAVALAHSDTRCREAAVAALGSLGDPKGFDAVLQALGDKPPVRRRAVVALAGFEGELAEAALVSCLEDRDWQVRDAARRILDA